MKPKYLNCLRVLSAVALLSAPQLTKADAIGWKELNAAGVQVANGVIPSGCPNPLPQTFFCGPDPFALNTPDGNFSVTLANDTVTNFLGLFQTLNVQMRANDVTGVNGSLILDVNQTYAFSGIANFYTAFEFMNGFFGGPAGLGLPNGNTNVIATLSVDGLAPLPVMGATAADADALGFTRGFCCSTFPTPPAAGVTFDALVRFNFLSANQVAGDFIDLPVGETDAPEPATVTMLAAGALALGLVRYRRRTA